MNQKKKKQPKQQQIDDKEKIKYTKELKRFDGKERKIQRNDGY